MKAHLQIDKKDYRAFYLYLYFNSKNPLIRIMRYVGGPILIAAGVYMLRNDEKFAVAYGGFCVGYGVYYILKPFLFVILKRFKPQHLSMEINGPHLVFEAAEGKSEVNISRLKTYKTKRYFVIKLENNQSVFLPKDKLGETVSNLLDQQITSVA